MPPGLPLGLTAVPDVPDSLSPLDATFLSALCASVPSDAAASLASTLSLMLLELVKLSPDCLEPIEVHFFRTLAALEPPLFLFTSLTASASLTCKSLVSQALQT